MFVRKISIVIILIGAALQGVNSGSVRKGTDPLTYKFFIKMTIGTWYLQGAMLDFGANDKIPKNSRIKIEAIRNPNSNDVHKAMTKRLSIDGEAYDILRVDGINETQAFIEIAQSSDPTPVRERYPFTVIHIRGEFIYLNCFLCPLEKKIYSRSPSTTREQLKLFDEIAKSLGRFFKYVGYGSSDDDDNRIVDRQIINQLLGEWWVRAKTPLKPADKEEFMCRQINITSISNLAQNITPIELWDENKTSINIMNKYMTSNENVTQSLTSTENWEKCERTYPKESSTIDCLIIDDGVLLIHRVQLEDDDTSVIIGTHESDQGISSAIEIIPYYENGYLIMKNRSDPRLYRLYTRSKNYLPTFYSPYEWYQNLQHCNESDQAENEDNKVKYKDDKASQEMRKKMKGKWFLILVICPESYEYENECKSMDIVEGINGNINISMQVKINRKKKNIPWTGTVLNSELQMMKSKDTSPRTYTVQFYPEVNEMLLHEKTGTHCYEGWSRIKTVAEKTLEGDYRKIANQEGHWSMNPLPLYDC